MDKVEKMLLKILIEEEIARLEKTFTENSSTFNHIQNKNMIDRYLKILSKLS